jgi:type IV pilus assembly protein PilP
MTRALAAFLATACFTFGLGSGTAHAADDAPPVVATVAAEPADDTPYDPTGRRDPFRAPRTAAPTATGEPQTPLERYQIGQLRLVAVIYDTQQPRAVVEDGEGLGYIVRLGTPIGPNGGTVRGIERGRVLISEDAVDFYGERHPSDVVMELRTADRGRRR